MMKFSKYNNPKKRKPRKPLTTCDMIEKAAAANYFLTCLNIHNEKVEDIRNEKK